MNKSSDKWKWNCDNCGNRKQYNEFFDSYFCPKCNEWNENKCDDDSCEYCIKRPKKPIRET